MPQKLTDLEIHEIRRRRKEGEYAADIARALGISTRVVLQYTKDIKLSKTAEPTLTPLDIREMRRRREEGEAVAELAQMFGVSPGTVYTHTADIVPRAPDGKTSNVLSELEITEMRRWFAQGKSRAEIAAELSVCESTVYEYTADMEPPKLSRESSLSKLDVQEMRRMYEDGVPQAEIARQFGVTHSTVAVRIADIVQREKREMLRGCYEQLMTSPHRFAAFAETLEERREQSDPELRALVHTFCGQMRALRQEILARRHGRVLRPCEHCRWRRNGEAVPVCIGYCETIGKGVCV